MSKRASAATATLVWNKAATDRPPLPDASPPLPPPVSGDWVLMPEREQQTPATLRPESEAWAHATLQRTEGEAAAAPRSLMHYLAETRVPLPVQVGRGRATSPLGPSALPTARRGRGGAAASVAATADATQPPRQRDARPPKALAMFGGTGAQNDRLLGEPVSLEQRLIMASNHLMAAAAGGGRFLPSLMPPPPPPRGRGTLLKLGTPSTGPLGAYIQWAAKPRMEEYQHLFDAFFAEDTWSAQVTMREQDPNTFAPYRELVKVRESHAHVLTLIHSIKRRQNVEKEASGKRQVAINLE